MSLPNNYRPVKTAKITQEWGENGVCCKTMPGGFPIIPYILIDKPLTGLCPQGFREYYKTIGLAGHNGRDWSAWYSEPVYHAALFSGWQHITFAKDGALNVDVVSDAPIAGYYFKRRYSHGAKHVGYERKAIKPGDCIMLAGKSGGATATHVHEAYKLCDVNGNDIKTENGYNGAVQDPAFTNKFILDYLAEQRATVVAAPPPPPPVKLDSYQALYKALFQASVFLDGLINRQR